MPSASSLPTLTSLSLLWAVPPSPLPTPPTSHLDISPSSGQELFDDVGAVTADCAGVVLIVLGGYVVNLAEETLHTAALKEEEGEAMQGGE